MRLSKSAAKALVNTASSMLPSGERQTMREAWAADLEFSEELEISPASIGVGALVYSVRRLACLNRRRRSAAALWYALAAIAAGLFITPWMIPLAAAIGITLWLVAVPAPADSHGPGPGADDDSVPAGLDKQS